MQFLFFTRLFLWLLTFALPAIHPSIAVPYDRSGWWLWFFLVPGEMLISFYLSPPRFRVRIGVGAGCVLLLLSILIFSDFSSSILLYTVAGTGAWMLTALIFKTGGRGYPAVVVEQFFLGFLFYKLITFSRASESIARDAAAVNRVVFVLFICVFLIHGAVLYFSAFERGKSRGRIRELGFFLGAAVSAAVLIVLLLPDNFVSHSVVFNFLKPEPRPSMVPLDEQGQGLELGNLRSSNWWYDQWPGTGQSFGSQGDREREADLSGDGQNMLEGIDADKWPLEGRGQGGENRQYAVMVVASSREPVYASEAYFNRFDPERGFLYEDDHPLNELTHIRLLETWEDRERPPDSKRYPQTVFFLSMFPERMLPYRPYRIEPTVLNKKFHPFNYSYNAVSMTSHSGVQDWLVIVGLDEKEKKVLEEYLEIPLSQSASHSFEAYLQDAIQGKTGYFEKVYAIFESFSRFHYELGFEDNVSVTRMEEFLMRERCGDCTDFSNSTAILARMAGIPSRVVTGYLASRTLQQPAHRRGIRVLRETVEPLKAFPLQDLYLVTTAHHHSWVQLYMPGYGWVDFDPTSFAIPPPGGGLIAKMRVVIPLIRVEETPLVRRFPWLLLARSFLMLCGVLVIGMYLYRYGKELYLRRLAGGRGPESLRALFTLLLMKLRANGYDPRIPSQTPMEYARPYPELQRFASIYTVLRYRENYEPGEKAQLWRDVRVHYDHILHVSKRQGFLNALRRGFSLRGLNCK